MTLDIKVARLIDATPEQVFDAFTDPEGQRGIPTAELREEHERGVPDALARLERTILAGRTRTDTRPDPAP